MAHVSDEKKQEVLELAKLISDNPIVGVVNMEDLPAPQLQVMRTKLRESVILRMSKKRLIKLALSQSKKEGVNKLADHVRGMPALLFTHDNPFTLYKVIKKNKSKAPAKEGQTAPNDIEVKAGATPFMPGPIIGELGALGIKTGVENGKIAIKQDSIVAKEGDIITKELASILTRLGIDPMEVGLDITAVFEKGVIYTKSVLDVDEEQFMTDIESALRSAINLSVFAGYPTRDTMGIMLQKASTEALALGLEAAIYADSTVLEQLLGKATRQALGLANDASISIDTTPTESSAPKKPETKIEEPQEKPAEASQEDRTPEPEKRQKEEPIPETAPESPTPEPKEESDPEPKKEPIPEKESKQEPKEEPAPEAVSEPVPQEEQESIPEPQIQPKTEEPITPSEEPVLRMDLGEQDEDVYTKEGREKLVEEDEISPQEEGFVQGEEDAGSLDKNMKADDILQVVQQEEEKEVAKPETEKKAEQSQKEQKEVEDLTQQLLRKGTLRK